MFRSETYIGVLLIGVLRTGVHLMFALPLPLILSEFDAASRGVPPGALVQTPIAFWQDGVRFFLSVHIRPLIPTSLTCHYIFGDVIAGTWSRCCRPIDGKGPYCREHYDLTHVTKRNSHHSNP